MAKWFINDNERVTGPFTTDEVKDQVHMGQIKEDLLIWGKPQIQWHPVSWWMKELPSILDQQPVNKSEQLWHFAIEGSSHGPLKRPDLIEELKKISSVDEVLVWTKGMKSWIGLFEFHDILDEMGINRRQHPRAAINGQAVLELDGQSVIAKLESISEGGFGAQVGDLSLSMGQTCHVEVRADNFSEPIAANATVQYITDTGYIGFKFQSLHSEAKVKIIEYVKAQEEIRYVA